MYKGVETEPNYWYFIRIFFAVITGRLLTKVSTLQIGYWDCPEPGLGMTTLYCPQYCDDVTSVSVWAAATLSHDFSSRVRHWNIETLTNVSLTFVFNQLKTLSKINPPGYKVNSKPTITSSTYGVYLDCLRSGPSTRNDRNLPPTKRFHKFLSSISSGLRSVPWPSWVVLGVLRILNSASTAQCNVQVN